MRKDNLIENPDRYSFNWLRGFMDAQHKNEYRPPKFNADAIFGYHDGYSSFVNSRERKSIY